LLLNFRFLCYCRLGWSCRAMTGNEEVSRVVSMDVTAERATRDFEMRWEQGARGQRKARRAVSLTRGGTETGGGRLP
jgi:hypothetical protein